MASSFAEQIPVILWVIKSLQPTSILDVGKGFGKYGFLVHEYCGIDPHRRPNPTLKLKEQSSVTITGVDKNEDYSFLHLSHFYDDILIRDITTRFDDLGGYELILMCDVIEHLQKADALRLLRFFLSHNARILISTPRRFFQQDLYESEAERHVSHWTIRDFRELGCYISSQNAESGKIFMLSSDALKVRGFGNSMLSRIRRIGRLLINELG